jgi:hypothetical protein
MTVNGKKRIEKSLLMDTASRRNGNTARAAPSR